MLASLVNVSSVFGMMGYPTQSAYNASNYAVRGLTEATGEVRAEGSVINQGRTIATAEGRLSDSQGKLLAHGTTTCLMMPLE